MRVAETETGKAAPSVIIQRISSWQAPSPAGPDATAADAGPLSGSRVAAVKCLCPELAHGEPSMPPFAHRKSTTVACQSHAHDGVSKLSVLKLDFL